MIKRRAEKVFSGVALPGTIQSLEDLCHGRKLPKETLVNLISAYFEAGFEMGYLEAVETLCRGEKKT